MVTGTVKWFNNQKGFGFICPTEGGEDIFAHFSTVEMDGYKSLKSGQTVSFDISRGPKGLHATNIQVVGESATQTPSTTTSTPLYVEDPMDH
jgi:CspA family cold shock protein